MTRSVWTLGATLLALALAHSACSDPEEAKRTHFDQANAHMAAGRTQEAIIQYRNAIKIDRRFGEAYLKLGDAYAKAEALPQAAKAFITAAELLPNSLDAQTKAATFRLLAGDFTGARAYAEAALKVSPGDVQAQILLANSLAGLRDIPSALHQLEEAIQLAPTDSRPYTSLGAIHVSQGERTRAEEAFRKAVAAEPKAVRPRLALGYFLWVTDRGTEAEAEFKRAVELESDDRVALHLLSLFYISLNRHAEAETPLLRLANLKDQGAMRTLADLYIRTNRAQQAKTLLEALKEKADTRTFAITRLAQIDYTAGRQQEAHNALDAVLKDDPNNPEYLALQARWLVAERKTEEALTTVKKAVVAAPESATVQYTLGLVHTARAENEEAIRAFNETLRLNPKANVAELQLSRLLLQQGQMDQGLARARAVAKDAPGSVDARLAVATGLIGKQDLIGAETEVKALLKEFPKNSSVHALNGLLLAKRGATADAGRALDRALELNPSDFVALNGKLALDLEQGRTAEARAVVERALNRGPVIAPLLVIAARVENTAKNPSAAEKYLRQAIDLEPDDIAAYSMLGQMYVQQNRLDEARRELEQLVRRRPDNLSARTMIGIILDAQGKFDESQKLYESILSSTSRAPVAANNLAYIYADRGERLNEALTLAQRAKEQLPDSHEVSDTLGWVYYKKDMAQLAIRPLQASVEKDPTNPLYHYHLGLAYAKAGETTRARKSLEQALKLSASFPGSDEARKALASLKG